MRIKYLIFAIILILSVANATQVCTTYSVDQISDWFQVTQLSNGNILVLFELWQQDGDESGIFGEILKPTLQPIKTTFQLNSFTQGSQRYPSASPLSDGGFIATWVSHHDQLSDWELHGQIFEPDGSKRGEYLTLAKGVNIYEPTVIGLNDGGFAVGMVKHYNQLIVTRFLSDGTKVNTVEVKGSDLSFLGGCKMKSGDYIFSWAEQDKQDTNTIHLQAFDKTTGDQLFNKQLYSMEKTQDAISNLNLACLNDGGYTITYQKHYYEQVSYDIKSIHFDATHNEIGNQTLVRFGDSRYRTPKATLLTDGRIVIIQENRSLDCDRGGIFIEIFDQSGQRIGKQFKVNEILEDYELDPFVMSLSNGGLVIGWNSDEFIHEDQYDMCGQPPSLCQSSYHMKSFKKSFKKQVPCSKICQSYEDWQKQDKSVKQNQGSKAICYKKTEILFLPKVSLPIDEKIVSKPIVFFVLGGPGSGKGTQCSRMAKELGFVHLSAGDLLRQEKRSGSRNGDLILEYINKGAIVPVEITVNLLKTAMEKKGWEKTKFLIDGFPRNQENLEGWIKEMGNQIDFRGVLFLDGSEETETARILKRNRESDEKRSDDDIEIIKKRFNTYKIDTLPIVNYFDQQNLVFKVDAERSIDDVFDDCKKILTARAFQNSQKE